MGAEQGGPREEDLRIRTESGEPDSRIKDIKRARNVALSRDAAIGWAKPADEFGMEPYASQEEADAATARRRGLAEDLSRGADIEELDPNSSKALSLKADRAELYARRYREMLESGINRDSGLPLTETELELYPKYIPQEEEKAAALRKKAEAAGKEGK
jgi:hypothetical protein